MFELLRDLIRDARRRRGFDLPATAQPPAIDVAEKGVAAMERAMRGAALALGLEVDVHVYRSPISARSAVKVRQELSEMLLAVCELAVDSGIDPVDLVKVAVKTLTDRGADDGRSMGTRQSETLPHIEEPVETPRQSETLPHIVSLCRGVSIFPK